MDSDSQSSKDSIIWQIAESYGKLLYSYEAQICQAEIFKRRLENFRWIQIVSSSISSASFLTSLAASNKIFYWITGVGSLTALLLETYLKGSNLNNQIKESKSTSDQLWLIREKYISLLTDSDKLNEQDLISKRDDLLTETSQVYKTAPITSSKAYDRAQELLKKMKPNTLSHMSL